MAKSFTRLDKLLVDKGCAPTRERAQALILAAKVLVDGHIVTKAGHKVLHDAEVHIVEEINPYVSRGGLKLEHAIRTFSLEISGSTALDAGASTGGFTDCLLSFGARRVYAVDVGYGQLALKLRTDPRVIVLERKNIRYLAPEDVPEPIQIGTIDTSFISLKLVIPAVIRFLEPEGVLVSLIKPQFEVGKELASKGRGVVRDPRVHEQVCASIAAFAEEIGLHVLGIVASPVLGPKGNREFLMASRLP